MTNFHINRNVALSTLQELLETSFKIEVDYLSDSFLLQQQLALDLFKKRIFLEKTIDETIAFNKRLTYPKDIKNIQLVTNAEDLIDVFKLRSHVYTEINYQSQFPDTIEGLNFDVYDSHSAVLAYKTNNTMTATAKLIFAKDYELLPSEKNFNLSHIRKEYNKIGEIARLIVKNEKKGLSFEFKYLLAGIYHVFVNNDINMTISCIKKEHTKLYEKFGGGDIVESTDNFATLGVPINILKWNPAESLPYFHKLILS
jgi:hypothetical protein